MNQKVKFSNTSLPAYSKNIIKINTVLEIIRKNIRT